MQIASTEQLVNLTLGKSRYTPEEQAAIGEFMAAMQRRHETIREVLAAMDPAPYTLSEYTMQRWTSGVSPTPEITVYAVLPGRGNARAGYVEPVEGGWRGCYEAGTSPRVLRGRRGLQDAQHEAALDVLVRYVSERV